VPPADAKALADAIVKLASNRSLCTKMGEQSRAIVKEDLSAEAVTKLTSQFYLESIDKIKAGAVK
jgi:glycosyltransferase involved in cell wall biosynthesis